MTILNLQSDGLPSVMITLAIAVNRQGEIFRDKLIEMCTPPQVINAREGDISSNARLRATLSRWITLGLFEESDGRVILKFPLSDAEKNNKFNEYLSEICSELLFKNEHALPLWSNDGLVSEENAGRSADLCRGLAWCLAQDIYTLPSNYSDLEDLVRNQIDGGHFIFLNDTRWTGLRTWALYLGFATGEDSTFIFDPTIAVRSQLKKIIKEKESLPAGEFLSRLASQLPVLDKGIYRVEVEQRLKTRTWRSPPSDHLSSSLSFALRRLHKQGTIALETMADAGYRTALTGQLGRTWEDFTHVRLLRSAE
jgi:hypothetical protein